MRRTAIVFAVLVLVCGCTQQEAFSDARRDLGHQDEVIVQLRKRNTQLMADARELKGRLLTAQTEITALRRGRETLDDDMRALGAQLNSFEERFGKLNDLEGILLKSTADGVALEVADTVLFAPGKSKLKDAGAKLLRDLAQRISAHEGPIRIEGHTDNQPVVVTASTYPMGNLQLSGRRALVVAHFLVKECSMPAGRVSYAGYGEHRPVVANSTLR